MNTTESTTKENKRTIRQNKALHLWFTMLANDLNNAGLDMRVVLKPEIDIPWTPANVKEHIYKPILKALTLKESTTQMDTKDPTVIWDIINRHLGEKFDFEVPAFPSEELLDEYLKSYERNI